MKNLKFPTAQTLLVLIAGFVAILTWVVPSGEYETLMYDAKNQVLVKNSGGSSIDLPAEQRILDSLNVQIPIENFTSGAIYKPISIPDSYKELEPRPQGLAAFFKSPIRGIIASADIIFLVLVIGGLVGVMNYTGAFDAGIGWMTRVLKGHEYILIILVTTMIALGGTTFGLAEETMAFYPILIPAFLAARYDAMVGLACIFLGSSIGTMCSTVNPFAAIIASDAAGIQWTTGLIGRVGLLTISLLITILYILKYAQKVKKDPSKSLIFKQKKELEETFLHRSAGLDTKFTPRLILITIVFATTFVVMIIGVSKLGWWFVEMTSTFLVGAILISIIGKVKEEKFVTVFSKGAGELLGVAFIIGIARGISILMDDGLISDTVLYYASGLVEGMPKDVFANVMLIVYGGLSFFMPSSSGMAVLTMPIMAPLGDAVGVGREIVVNAYMYGMGLFFLVSPTGLILAALAVVKIGFEKWLRFVLPLLLILTVVAMGYMSFSVYV